MELNLEQSYLANDKSKAALRNRSSEIKVLIIDKTSIVSSHLWTVADWGLLKIFMIIPEKGFGGLSVVTDLLQLTLARENLYFHDFLIRII